jgi:hypothetical protein
MFSTDAGRGKFCRLDGWIAGVSLQLTAYNRAKRQVTYRNGGTIVRPHLYSLNQHYNLTILYLMKKTYLTLVAAFILIQCAFAQNTFPPSGNTGIGTGKPAYPLQVNGIATFTDGTSIGVGALGIPAAILGSQTIFSTTASDNFKIANFNYAEQKAATVGSIQGTEGFVAVSHPSGIVNLALGTIGNVQLNSNQTLASAVSVQGGGNTSMPGTITSWKIFNAGIGNTGSAKIAHAYGLFVNTFPAGVGDKYGVYVADSNANNFFAGNVGIGVATPLDKLSVGGTIRANDVKVDLDLTSNVLKPGYILTPLLKLRAYIDRVHSLPQMPVAGSNTNDGVSLVEMNNLLLQKVEELTLYLLEKDKQIKELEEKQQAQDQISQKLLKQLIQIQNQLNNNKKLKP